LFQQARLLNIVTSQAFKHSFFFPFRFDGVFSPHEHEQPEAMAGAVEGLTQSRLSGLRGLAPGRFALVRNTCKPSVFFADEAASPGALRCETQERREKDARPGGGGRGGLALEREGFAEGDRVIRCGVLDQNPQPCAVSGARKVSAQSPGTRQPAT
jgi:hypothetical protein